MITPVRASLLYIASPFTHPDPVVSHGRFVDVCRATAYLIDQGWLAYSPITHTVPLGEYGSMKTTWKDWESYDTRFLTQCHGLALLKLNGWERSVGVQAELTHATQLRLQLYSIDPKTFEVSLGI